MLKYKKEEMIHGVKAVAFDLDGTIYQGNKMMDGVIELIDFLKRKCIKIFYFTNNSTKTRSEIFEKLSKMGLKLSIKDVYNSAYSTAVYVKNNKLNDVYCIGSKGLVKELTSKKVRITEDEEKVRAVIIGLDVKFDYNKISKALNILRRGCKLIVCNKDRDYPVEGGRLMPGSGPIVSAIEYIRGKEADYMVGKPNTYMIELLANEHKLENNEILVVGDSYDSDIEMAKKYNCLSILISKEVEPDIKDTLFVKNIIDIQQLFDKEVI